MFNDRPISRRTLLREGPTAAGYALPRAVGEVVAAGEPTPAGVVERWMHSPRHRAILMDAYRHLGVGCGLSPATGVLYWTVDLGRPIPSFGTVAH